MESNRKYYVIQFEKPPTEDYDKYVCVPLSWVIGRDNGKIVFRYPVEKMTVTKRRILESEKASEEWPIYLETVKYETDNYTDAKKFHRLMEKTFNKGRRRNSQVNSKCYKPILKSKLPNRETQEHRNTDYETDESDEERMDEEDFVETPSHNHKTPEKIYRRSSAGCSKDNPTTNIASSSNSTLNDPSSLHTIGTSLQALVKEMKRQNDCIEKLHQDYTVNRDASLYSVVLLKEIAKKLSIDVACLNSNDTVSENRTDTQNAQNQSAMISKRRRSVRIQEEPTRIEDEGTPKRQFIRPFSLPNEYDANDSRWTLRYRAMEPGLEELMKGTGVYIDAIRFANCKRLARDEKTLARLLLLEIFTEKALGTCSLTGARAKAFDPDGTNTRPGLDERARNVLLNFVEEYCREKQWVSSERQSIMNTLRNKMQEIRARYMK